MSTYPPISARVSALERRQNQLDARIEELAENITDNFKKLSDTIEENFKQAAVYVGHTDDRLDKIESNITTIVTTQKEHTTRLTNIETLLTLILEHLPKN